MSRTPIGDHALLSDRHSAALVDTAGSVEWLSFPRFDSPSVLGRLLDGEAGHWQVRPVGEWTQRAAIRRPHARAGDHLHDRRRAPSSSPT